MVEDGSILTEIKQTLGLAEAEEAFDPELVTYINGCFSTLHSLGVGPSNGFAIRDKTAQWSDFMPLIDFDSQVPVFIGLQTRLIFDTPDSSYAVIAFEKQLDEMKWRMNTRREESEWEDPRDLEMTP